MQEPFPCETNGIPGAEFSERRREPRRVCEDIAAEVRTESGSFTARIMDISRSGLRVEVRERLEVDSEVTVYFNNMVAACEVRYCAPNENGAFNAGLRMQDVMRSA